MSESGNTLLVIDDDTIVRKSVVAYLEDSGFNVVEAVDGQQGLELLRAENPDLVICDLRMPNLDGISVLRAIDESDYDVPVIVVSGAGDMGDVVQALRLGASDYFIKPVAEMALLEMSIRRGLEQARLRHENQRYRQRIEQANLDLKQNLSVLEQDQQAGRYVQMKMLPETPKQIGNYQFSHFIIPSLYLSGDFVEYITVGNEHVTFFIADVSGHGASSAFVTVLLKNLAARLRSSFMHASDFTILSPAKILEKANAELLSLDLGKHVTMFVGVLNTNKNSLRYSMAGHLPAPILAGPESACYLEGTGRPVGLFEDTTYEESSIDLPSVFSLSLFSDGILEILPKPTLAEKEAYLLQMFQGKVLSLKEIIGMLNLSEVKDAPDDIAVMTVATTGA